MGQKGAIKMDVDSLVDAVSTAKAAAQGIEASVGNIRNLMKELDDTNVLKGGKPSADIVAGVTTLQNGCERNSQLVGKISEYVDKLSVKVETQLHGSNAGAKARAAGEEAQKNIQSVRN